MLILIWFHWFPIYVLLGVGGSIGGRYIVCLDTPLQGVPWNHSFLSTYQRRNSRTEILWVPSISFKPWAHSSKNIFMVVLNYCVLGKILVMNLHSAYLYTNLSLVNMLPLKSSNLYVFWVSYIAIHPRQCNGASLTWISCIDHQVPSFHPLCHLNQANCNLLLHHFHHRITEYWIWKGLQIATSTIPLFYNWRDRGQYVTLTLSQEILSSCHHRRLLPMAIVFITFKMFIFPL